LSITYSNANWIPASYPDPKIRIMGEAPIITATTDSLHDRIILAYQCQDGQTTFCTEMINNPNRSHMSIVTLNTDEVPVLLGETAWYDSHTSFGLIPVYPGPSGVTFNATYWSQLCDWNANGLQGARMNYGQPIETTWFCNGADTDVESYSEDGWVVIFDAAWVNRLCNAK
jgi:hypothetical protein